MILTSFAVGPGLGTLVVVLLVGTELGTLDAFFLFFFFFSFFFQVPGYEPGRPPFCQVLG